MFLGWIVDLWLFFQFDTNNIEEKFKEVGRKLLKF